MTERKTDTAKAIASALGETKSKPTTQIERIVSLCGSAFANIMLDAAVATHEDGGIKTQDGKRNRTVGGVFFYLVRGALPPNLHDEIFPAKHRRHKLSPDEVLDWDERLDYFSTLMDKPKGEVKDVNISVDGRPTHIEKKNHLVVATLQSHVEAYQTFPRGVPDVPTAPTTFIVYVGEDQWDKHIGTKLEKDEDATLAVEGAPAYDDEMGGIAVFARAVKVKSGASNRKAAKAREERQQKAEETERKSKQAAAARREKERQKVAVDDDIPDDIAKKLRPLYGARELFRKRLADIEALPEDKQSGLKAAKMALERTESQIAALEAQAKEDA